MHCIRFLTIPSALVLSALGSACATEEQRGSLTINYTIGFGSECADFDVARVRATVGANEASEEANCDPNQPLVFDSLPAGRHDLLVQGFDAAGDAIMDNLDIPTDDDFVEIIGGSARTVDVNLAPAPAQLEVRWVVAIDGQPTNCEFVGPKKFRVQARKQMGAKIMLQHDFPCAVPPGYQAVPDPGREIDGTVLDAVSVDMLGSNNQVLDTVRFRLDAPPGPGKVVQIDIHCDGTQAAPVCSGTVATPSGVNNGGGGGDDGGTGAPASDSGAEGDEGPGGADGSDSGGADSTTGA